MQNASRKQSLIITDQLLIVATAVDERSIASDNAAGQRALALLSCWRVARVTGDSGLFVVMDDASRKQNFLSFINLSAPG